MDKYKKIKKVGSGTYGSVWQARNKQTGEAFAIKKIKKKYYSWKECKNLREFKSLRRMNHPNIVKLKEVIKEHDTLYFVFEYMECNLYQLMQSTTMYIPEARIKKWCFQVLQGLAHVHQRGFFHRDLKPDNLLVSKDACIKIADFGLAREIESQPPYTEYVMTRWYRAPEVLLRSPKYSAAVDMWAMGTIMAELFTLYPLFSGSTEADQLDKICSVIGRPTETDWAEGLELASVINYQFPQVNGVHLSTLMPSASEEAINLITLLCSWDPSKRPTSLEALQHPLFKSCSYNPSYFHCKGSVAKRSPSDGTRLQFELNTDGRYSGTSHRLMPTSNLSPIKSNAPAHACEQRKLEIICQNKQRHLESTLKQQSKYQLPVMNDPVANHIKRTHGVPDTAEKPRQRHMLLQCQLLHRAFCYLLPFWPHLSCLHLFS